MSETIVAMIARSLGDAWSARREAILQWVERERITPGALEASIRAGRDGVRGGRMMIERLDASVAASWLCAVGVPRTEIAARLLTVGRRLGLPFIVGWDIGSERPMAKLYLNASDASEKQRARACEALPPSLRTLGAPHVVGLNLHEQGWEVKLYMQHARPPMDAAEPVASWFDRFAERALAAGFVTSYQLERERPVTRAWFVALRSRSEVKALVEQLPGWSAVVADGIPFTPGAVTSLGFSATSNDWTLYLRPHAVGATSWTLDPCAAFTDGRCEVGIFVEPKEQALDSYAIVGSSAVSYRVRAGVPNGAAIDCLMQWVIQHFDVLEEPLPRMQIELPRPWHVVRPD